MVESVTTILSISCQSSTPGSPSTMSCSSCISSNLTILVGLPVRYEISAFQRKSSIVCYAFWVVLVHEGEQRAKRRLRAVKVRGGFDGLILGFVELADLVAPDI